MLIEPILIGLVLGLVLKGSLRQLAQIRLRGIYLPLLAFGIESGAGLINEGMILSSQVTLGVQIFVYCLLLLFFAVNWQNAGLRLVGLGVLLNAVVIFANGGYMPVSTVMAQRYGFAVTMEALQKGALFGHKVLLSTDRLTFLSDIIRIPPPYWFPKTVSVGDLLMDFGLMMTLIKGMRGGE